VIYKRPFGEASILDTEIWKNDPDEWERVRIEAGQELARRSRKKSWGIPQSRDADRGQPAIELLKEGWKEVTPAGKVER
jgi:hypothetical protein